MHRQKRKCDDQEAGFEISRTPSNQLQCYLPVAFIEAIRAEIETAAALAQLQQLIVDDETEDTILSMAENSAANESRHAQQPSVQVFNPDAVAAAIKAVQKEDKERAAASVPTLELAENRGGWRILPCAEVIPTVRNKLHALATDMPNFAAAISFLLGELALAIAGPVDSFRVTPICLFGAPGIGKTRFVREVASILNVGFETIALGGVGGNFELVGVSAGYSNARPGRIARLLAESVSAAPIVLLDEIDKVSTDDRFSVIPALLDLLEPTSASQFRDEALGIRMDASKVIYLGTANDVDAIPPPLRSRMRMVEVTTPKTEQRRHIAGVMACEYDAISIHFPEECLDLLCTADVDLRELQRLMRDAAGRALIGERAEVTCDDFDLPVLATTQRIGFL